MNCHEENLFLLLLFCCCFVVILFQSFGASLSAAKRSFEDLYRDKTGNRWGVKGNKVTGKFYPLEIDYGQDEDAAGKLVSEGAGSTSKLPKEIQQLVRMLFDVESMKKAMLEFEVRKVELMVF